MGLSMLPDELLVALQDEWPCRNVQLEQLSALLSPSLPSPPTLMVHGPKSAGKSSIVQSYLERAKLPHAVVPSQECVTGRHFLERTASAVQNALHKHAATEDTAYAGRCENISALLVHLQRLVAQTSHFVLVLDGIDRQRDPPPTLLPALARFGESIPGLTVVLIVRYPHPRLLHQSGVPHIHFTSYGRTQSIHIVSQKPLDIFLEPPADDLDYDDETHAEDKAWLWPRFCAAVWDALAQNAARDLKSYQDACHKLWRPFIAPVIKGDFGTRDFSRLMVSQRRLFQDESVLLDHIVAKPDLEAKSKTHDLPYYAKWLMIAAYLASFNPTRLDTLHFMKSTERKRRKKGGGTARSGGRPSQTRKIPRHLLAASAFTVDRLLAILHAILPDDIKTNIDIYKQIASLSSLRLLVRTASIGSSDPLEPGGKWRVGPLVNWEYVRDLARGLDFNITDYVAE